MEQEPSMAVPRPAAFVGSLIQLDQNQDREALANLRGYIRGSTGDQLRAAKYVAPYLGERSFPSDRWFYVVGGLFAYHPLHIDKGPSLGGAMGLVDARAGSVAPSVLTALVAGMLKN